MNNFVDVVYTAKTDDIIVKVQPVFLDDASEPQDDQYQWAYAVHIANVGKTPIQVMGRHWEIIDGYGTTTHVDGEGVVGEKPIIPPGQHYEYTSGTPLNTPSGVMMGTYRIRSADNTEFDVTIPPFALSSPYDIRQIQ